MKKVLILPVLCGALLAGCGTKDNSIEVLGQKCEKIATGERGDFVVKCPMVPEFDAIRHAAKNSMFLSVTPSDAAIADTENAYIDVVVAGTIEGLDVNCYRFLGVEPVVDGENVYAVEVCEQ